MGGSTFTGSYAGIGEMLRSEFLETEMKRRAQRVADIAIANAPVYEVVELDEPAGGDPHRGRYKESFTVTSTRNWHTRRCAGIVTNDAPEALEVEWGVRHRHKDGVITVQEGRHTLRNALMAGAGD